MRSTGAQEEVAKHGWAECNIWMKKVLTIYIVMPRRPSWMKKTSSHTRKSKDMLFRQFYRQRLSDAFTLPSSHAYKHYSVPAVHMPQFCQITEVPMPTTFVLYRAAQLGGRDNRRALRLPALDMKH